MGNVLDTTAKYLQRTMNGAAGRDLATIAKYLRCTTSSAAGNGLGTTIKFLCADAGFGLGTKIKYLRRTTSGTADNDLSRFRGLLMCPFITSAPHSPCFVAASIANKQKSLPRSGV